MAPPAPPRLRKLASAALFGLAVGMLIAGLVFMGSAARVFLTGLDCQQLSAPECAFERELASSIARTQLWIGAGLDLLAISALLSLRGRGRRPGD